MIVEKYKTLADKIINHVKGIQRTGMKVLELEDRHVKLLMPMAGNDNHVGIMYAGAIFSLGECMGGVIPLVSMDMTRFFPIVKKVSIHYIAPAMSDITLTTDMSQQEADMIQKTAEENGKADFDLELELKDVNDKTVAVMNGTWQVRRMNDEAMKLF